MSIQQYALIIVIVDTGSGESDDNDDDKFHTPEVSSCPSANIDSR